MKRITIAVFLVLILISAAACSPAATAPSDDTAQQIPVEHPDSNGNGEAIKTPAADTPQISPTEHPKDWVTVVVAFANFQDDEFAGVENAMALSGYSMEVVSTQTGEAAGMYGRTLAIEKTISEVDDYGLGVVVIGGTGSVVLWNDRDLISLIQRADADSSLIAAICAAPGALANAGALTDAQACWSNSNDLDAIMADAGCEDTGQPVTQYENVITANGPAAAQEFGEAIAAYLKGL